MKFIGPIAAVGLFCIPNLALAQVTLSFDDQPAGPLSGQYSSQGATFNFPMVRDYSQAAGFTHSGTKAIELCFAIEFCKAPLNVNFTTGQRRVKVFVGFTSQLNQPSAVRLTAFDQNGSVVTEALAMLGPSTGPIPVQVPLEVTSPNGRIRQITAGFASADAFNNGLAFDDLEFTRAGLPPVCPTQQNPTVALSLPPPNSTVQINEFTLQGIVQTGAPLEEATLTTTVPGNTRISSVLGPIVQPGGGSFGAIRVYEALFPGTNTVTLSARNCHGTGQASTTVIYSPVADGTVVKLLGMEITQATQDANNSVPLIAGKPTGVRLYFSTTGSTPITGVRGDITGFHEGHYTPLLAQSMGTTDIDSSQDVAAKRRDLTKSLNFILSPDFFEPGLTHFWVVRLNVEGPGGATLACDGCAYWTTQFRLSRPLNLVVAPFHYQLSNLTADAGASLLGGLGWLNNVFPISGNFPTDTAGINLTILPTGSTGLILPRDNDRFLFQLQNTLDDLQSQPGNTLPADTRILGVIPSGSGGAASMPGTVAYGDSRAIESATFPASDPESYGSIWAQELAHSFGRRHVSTSHGEMPPTDANFPYPHGGIGEPGLAIGTEQWNGFPFVMNPGTPADNSKHAHDFMSYGAPNDPANHTNSWVSPYTYTGLMGSFQPQAQAQVARPLEPTDKLLISGIIANDGTVTLRPFQIVRTALVKGSGTTGEFSLTLLGARGRTLLTYRFNARTIANSTSLGFSELVPWRSGTKRIVLRRNRTILSERIVSSHKPTVRVTSPKSGESWDAKGTIAWEATDADGDPLTYSVFYNSGLDSRWLPVATDITDTSITLDTTQLAGSTRARIRVRTTDGVNTTEAESSGTFTVPEKAPRPTILGMTNGQVLSGRSVEFSGAAYDFLDGMLSGNALQWTSDRDGPLGRGRYLKLNRPLSSGPHVITLTATNTQHRSGSIHVSIIVR